MIGKLVKSSGFEDAIFHSGICTSDCLQGVLHDAHYNRGWIVHKAFSEALERLLLQRFLYYENIEPIPTFQQYGEDNSNERGDIHNVIGKYERYHSEVRSGEKGKKAQFWMFYLDLFGVQVMAHSAVQENNLNMLISACNKFTPVYFVFNKINYVRYGSYYVFTLIHREAPGLRNLLDAFGISVQPQESFPLRTAVDQRGEQTINRDAKTNGKKSYNILTMNVCPQFRIEMNFCIVETVCAYSYFEDT